MKYLESLVSAVRANWQFTKDNYPALPTDLIEAEKFTVRHVALHMAKTAGVLATIAEKTDHGGSLTTESLEEVAAQSLINALKIAEVAGMSAEELQQRADRILRSVNVPKVAERPQP